MATNPMQRKARNSFLLGMLLMLIILGLVIAFLVMQLMNIKEEQEAEQAAMVQVYVLSQSVTSGQVITTDMLTLLTVNQSTVPANATSSLSTFQNYALQDDQGNGLITEYTDGEAQLYIEIDGDRQRVSTDENGNYINEETDEIITLSETPLIAKVNMEANTVLTADLISRGEVVEDSTRTQEYNMFVLPTDLETGDYIDIRLLLPSGTDYIVVSKKEVEIPVIGDVESSDTISIDLTEDEILTLSSAIIDAFQISGAKLYVNKYTEPGLQAAATPTYPVNADALDLIMANPNILETAKTALWNRYNEVVDINNDGIDETPQLTQRNDVINSAIEAEDDPQANLEENMQESIDNAITSRQEYLEGLATQAAAATTTTTE